MPDTALLPLQGKVYLMRHLSCSQAPTLRSGQAHDTAAGASIVFMILLRRHIVKRLMRKICIAGLKPFIKYIDGILSIFCFSSLNAALS